MTQDCAFSTKVYNRINFEWMLSIAQRTHEVFNDNIFTEDLISEMMEKRLEWIRELSGRYVFVELTPDPNYSSNINISLYINVECPCKDCKGKSFMDKEYYYIGSACNSKYDDCDFNLICDNMVQMLLDIRVCFMILRNIHPLFHPLHDFSRYLSPAVKYDIIPLDMLSDYHMICFPHVLNFINECRNSALDGDVNIFDNYTIRKMIKRRFEWIDSIKSQILHEKERRWTPIDYFETDISYLKDILKEDVLDNVSLN